MPLVVAAIVFGLVALLLSKTVLGRDIYDFVAYRWGCNSDLKALKPRRLPKGWAPQRKST